MNVFKGREKLSKKYMLKTDVVKLLRGIAGQMYINQEKRLGEDEILIERALSIVSDY